MASTELITEIEEGAVRADLALASTTYALLQRMEENAVLNEARRSLAASPEESATFLKRAMAVFDSPAPDGCSHPGDLSVSAYVFFLAHVLQQPAQEFVDRVAHSNRSPAGCRLGAGHQVWQSETGRVRWWDAVPDSPVARGRDCPGYGQRRRHTVLGRAGTCRSKR